MRPWILTVAVWLSCGACAGERPGAAAVEVDGIRFSEAEVEHLGVAQRERLAELTAFGLAVARTEVDRLGEPFTEQERRSRLLRRLAAAVALRQAGYDEAALRALYEADPEPELVVRHIVILSERWRSEAEREEARARAEAARRQVLRGEAFAEVAAAVSEEPGAVERGGLLQPGRRDSWVPEFWEAAVALEPGEISPVLETRYGFHVIRLEERRAVPFHEGRDELAARLAAEPEAVERADEWAREQAGAVVVDTGVVALWRADPADDLVLARWPDGRYTGADFRRLVSTLDADSRARLAAADAAGYAAVVAGAARNVFLAKLARERGVELTAEDSAAAARHWRLRAEAWASALGFSEGLHAEAVKAAALAGLASTRQGAGIARAEIAALGPLLRDLFELRVRPPAPQRAEGS